MADVVKNDTTTVLQLTLIDQSGQAIDLTGTTVNLVYYIDFEPPFVTKLMTIVGSPTVGVVSCLFTVDTNATPNVYDLYSAGVLYYLVRITYADGSVLTSPFLGEITVHPTIAL